MRSATSLINEYDDDDDDNPTRFHENRLKPLCVILITDKRTQLYLLGGRNEKHKRKLDHEVKFACALKSKKKTATAIL